MGSGSGRPAVADLLSVLGDAVADGSLVAFGGGELRRKPVAAPQRASWVFRNSTLPRMEAS